MEEGEFRARKAITTSELRIVEGLVVLSLKAHKFFSSKVEAYIIRRESESVLHKIVEKINISLALICNLRSLVQGRKGYFKFSAKPLLFVPFFSKRSSFFLHV